MRSLALLAVALCLGGCSTDSEERAFFNGGWIRPEDGANERMYGSPERRKSDKPDRPTEP
jgi:hypothetical protein